MIENRLVRSKSQLELTLAELKNCSDKKKYLAAQAAKDKTLKLRKQIESLEIKNLKNQQEKDLNDMKNFQQEEVRQFESRWNETLTKLDEAAEELLSEQVNTHIEEQKRVQKQFHEQLKTFHESGTILSLKQKELALAKIQNYMEAHSIQAERKRLEQVERKNWENLLQQKLKIRLRQLTVKQEQERTALLKKIGARIEEANNDKEKELNQLKKKHRNVMREFKSVHQKENLSTTGQIKNMDRTEKMASTRRIRSPIKAMLSHKRLQSSFLDVQQQTY